MTVTTSEADLIARARGWVDAAISFGQMLVPQVIERAMAAAGAAQVLLAVGSTLQVYPAAGAVPHARAAGARMVIVNDQPTPMDEVADVVIRTPIGQALPSICGE